MGEGEGEKSGEEEGKEIEREGEMLELERARRGARKTGKETEVGGGSLRQTDEAADRWRRGGGCDCCATYFSISFISSSACCAVF